MPATYDTAFPWRDDACTLDHLGNWIGGTDTAPTGRLSNGNLDNHQSGSGFALAGMYRTYSGQYAPWPAAAGVTTDPANDSLALRHSINQQNEIDSLQQIRDGAASTITFAYDPSGNLTDDGVYRYQYDAWGRLLSVHLRDASTPGQYGALVRAFNYDGLGRVVRAQSPYPDIGTAEGANRIERFYYDGVRRIQEVVIDPVSSMGEALMGASGSAAQAAANQTQQQSGQSNAALTLEEEATSLSIEAAQTSALTGGGTVPGFQVFAEREYIWGPGEGWGVAGTDELLAQFDRTGALTFAITDAGGDMVALVDSGGSSGRARVVGQWTYDAYGNVLSTDHLHPHAYTRVGHKGLIFDRLDVGVADRGDDGTFTAGQFVGHPGCDFDTPRIVPFARGFYHNRNRVYMPELGRFAQADPNASGQTLLDLPLYHGRGFSAASVSFDLQSRYGDGGSLFAYMGGNPWQRSDSLGLFINPVDLAGTLVMGAIRTLRGGVENMITTYAMHMELDIDWAMDWSQPDDWHTRGENRWVAQSFKEGLWGGLQDWFNEDVMGLIDPFGIRNIGDGDEEFDLGPMARRGPGAAWRTEARAANKLGNVAHHIISWYRHTASRVRDLEHSFKIKIDLQDPSLNMLILKPAQHGRGRHTNAYHARVFEYIRAHLEQIKSVNGSVTQGDFANVMKSLAEKINGESSRWFAP